MRSRRRARAGDDRLPPRAPEAREPAPGEIDVEELLARYSVEDLIAAADGYYARLDDRRYHLAKPYGSVDEAPARLATFGALLEALECAPGDVVLDFGAGSCWTSRPSRSRKPCCIMRRIAAFRSPW